MGGQLFVVVDVQALIHAQKPQGVDNIRNLQI